MTRTVADLKAAVDFRQLVAETHAIDRAGKVLCPAHSDNTPSCHVYQDSAHCFACGWHADAVTWLEVVYGLSSTQAIAELRRRAGGMATPLRRLPALCQQPRAEGCAARPVATDTLASYMRRAARLDRLPVALAGRGFTLDDARTLRMARDGEDGLFVVPGPDGVVLAIKRRRAHPGSGARYLYESPGCGTPAWTCFGTAAPVLVVEGELNAMACWLALPDMAVMGVAGTGGGLHLAALKGRSVYVYADGDAAGQRARDTWAQQALSAGANRVYALAPWDKDACEVAGEEGREALAALLTEAMEAAAKVEAVRLEPPAAPSPTLTYRQGVYRRLRSWT